ncbi:MAG TPA: metallophosphoesterase [Herpetosiphonaceae bacterium]
MRLLSISDEVERTLHSPALRGRVGAVDAILSCGDLPPSYLEYLVTVLNVPCLYVRGNHDAPELREDGGVNEEPQGCDNLDLRVRLVGNMLIAGVSGVVRYRQGPYQYSEQEWQRRLWLLAARTLLARRRHGRGLDILISHAPPRGLHDGPGAHQGSLALRRFIERIKPRYLIHGHVHLNYGYGDQSPLRHGPTTIINTCGYQLLEIEPQRALALEAGA